MVFTFACKFGHLAIYFYPKWLTVQCGKCYSRIFMSTNAYHLTMGGPRSLHFLNWSQVLFRSGLLKMAIPPRNKLGVSKKRGSHFNLSISSMHLTLTVFFSLHTFSETRSYFFRTDNSQDYTNKIQNSTNLQNETLHSKLNNPFSKSKFFVKKQTQLFIWLDHQSIITTHYVVWYI